MKHTRCLALVFTVAPLLATPAAAQQLTAAYEYRYDFVEDFDQMGLSSNTAPGSGGNYYWSVVANGGQYVDNLTIATNDANWGGSPVGYNAKGTDSDRHLAIHKTSAGESAYLTARLKNKTGQTLTQIRLSYDFECSWCRFPSNSSPEYGYFEFQYSTNNSTWVTKGTVQVNNDLIAPGEDRTWFSDAQMDTRSLSVRGAGGVFAVPALPADADFYLRWSGKTGGNRERFTIGIDNIRSVGPYIKNYDVTNPAYTSADLVGHLVYTGGAPTSVFCYWGPTDGGDITSGLWGETNDLGGATEGEYVTNTADLTSFSAGEFFFRFAATNSWATNWATSSDYFLNTNVWIVATDTNCAEEASDAGTFEIRRPGTVTNGALTVNYTISGSASNGVDYASLDGSVTLDVGQSNAVITISPVDDKKVETGGETVTITIAPGYYLIGTPNSRTLTIADDDFIPGSMVYFR